MAADYIRAQKSDNAKVALYKWEFLRRNPDYHKDYEAYAKDPEGRRVA